MKTMVFTLLLLTVAGLNNMFGQNPIPSYNIPVYSYANFQEQAAREPEGQPCRGKRSVHVTASGAASGMATVYIYTLDYSTIYGPYYLFWGTNACCGDR